MVLRNPKQIHENCALRVGKNLVTICFKPAPHVWCDMIVPHVSSIPVVKLDHVLPCTPRARDGMVMPPGMRLENNWVTARLHKSFPAGRRGQQPPGDGGISKSLRIGGQDPVIDPCSRSSSKGR